MENCLMLLLPPGAADRQGSVHLVRFQGSVKTELIFNHRLLPACIPIIRMTALYRFLANPGGQRSGEEEQGDVKVGDLRSAQLYQSGSCGHQRAIKGEEELGSIPIQANLESVFFNGDFV